MLVIYHIWDKDKKSIWLQCKDGYWSNCYADRRMGTHIPLDEAMIQIAIGAIPDPRDCCYDFRKMSLHYTYADRMPPFTLVKVWYLK